MTIQEINDAYNRIIVELDRKALKNAFDGLLGLIAGTNQYNFQDKLDELQETYKQMLHYRVKGVQDPMQDEIYERILASAYELPSPANDIGPPIFRGLFCPKTQVPKRERDSQL